MVSTVVRAAYPLCSGLFLAIVHWSLVWLLQGSVSSVSEIYFAVLVCWIVGMAAGLRLRTGVIISSALPVVSWSAVLVVDTWSRSHPFNLSGVLIYMSMVVVAALFAGQMFRQQTRYFDQIKWLFGWGVLGFALGVLLVVGVTIRLGLLGMLRLLAMGLAVTLATGVVQSLVFARWRPFLWRVAACIMGCGMLIGWWGQQPSFGIVSPTALAPAEHTALPDHVGATLLRVVRDTAGAYALRQPFLDSPSVSPVARGEERRVYVQCREWHGQVVGTGTAVDTSLAVAVKQATLRALQDSPWPLLSGDQVEGLRWSVQVERVRKPVPLSWWDSSAEMLQMGKDGLAQEHGGRWLAILGSSAVEQNETPVEFLYRARRAFDEWNAEQLEWASQMWLLQHDHWAEWPEPGDCVRLERGQHRLSQHDVTPGRVRDAIEAATDWYLHHQRSDGQLAYRYQPASNTYQSRGSPVRQMAASWALGQLAQWSDRRELHEAFRLNMDWQLTNQVLDGVIEGSPDPVLYAGPEGVGEASTTAYLALAMLEELGRAQNDPQLHMVQAALLGMQEANGRFRMLGDHSMPGGIAYDPAEPLLALMHLYERTRDPQALAAVARAWPFYRDAFLAHSEQANVSLLIQAYARAFRATDQDQYKNFVLQLGDWLVRERLSGTVAMAQGQPGSEHVSSATIGLDALGVLEAFRLARRDGDETRCEAYRVFLLHVCRSVLDLQSLNGDLYSTAHPAAARGGVRHSLIQSDQRSDQAQHAVMLWMGLLEYFRPNDWRIVASGIDKDQRAAL